MFLSNFGGIVVTPPMRMNLNRKVVTGAVVLAACAFAGGAYAASTDSGTSPRQAFLNDAAKRLGTTPQHLKDALAGALQDQLNAAVKAGKLTQAQANAIVQRFRQGDDGLRLEPFAFGGGFHAHHFGIRGAPLEAAAKYLGLSVPQLADQLRSGKSLAQVAGAQHKSTSGLENAIVSDLRTQLDKKRAAGEITSTQEQQMLARIQTKVKELVDHTGGFRHVHRFGGRLPGPPLGPPPGLPGPEPGLDGPPPAGPGLPS
jgi:hypothetical protein